MQVRQLRTERAHDGEIQRFMDVCVYEWNSLFRPDLKRLCLLYCFWTREICVGCALRRRPMINETYLHSDPE